jgi:hypothetical protein
MIGSFLGSRGDSKSVTYFIKGVCNLIHEANDNHHNNKIFHAQEIQEMLSVAGISCEGDSRFAQDAEEDDVSLRQA